MGLYRSRLNADKITKTTNASMDYSMFASSPNHTVVNIDGKDVEAIVQRGKNSDEKTLLIRDASQAQNGSIVSLNSEVYLAMDFNVDINEIYPKLFIQKCNDTIKWKDDSGIIYEYPCVITAKIAGKQNYIDRYMVMPEGDLLVYSQFNDNTVKVKVGHRFIFSNSQYTYEITFIDPFSEVTNGVGTIVYRVKPTVAESSDDFANRIAYNKPLSGDDGSAWRKRVTN